MNYEFTMKLAELRAKDSLPPAEQEALDTCDPEDLERLCRALPALAVPAKKARK